MHAHAHCSAKGGAPHFHVRNVATVVNFNKLLKCIVTLQPKLLHISKKKQKKKKKSLNVDPTVDM